MSRLVWLCLTSVLSFVGGNGFAHAYDYRVDPNAANRDEIRLSLTPEGMHAAAVRLDADAEGMPREYASAMTWYRLTLEDGYALPPLVASPWIRDEQLPEPLHWAWVADNGDLITRVDKGTFRMSFADNQNNWFRDVDCRLVSWPGGNTEAPMVCNDGAQRTMRIPGDGIVLVDDVQYTRVFDSDMTTLPPEEVISVDEMVAAMIKNAGVPAVQAEAPEAAPEAKASSSVILPEQGPIPQFR